MKDNNKPEGFEEARATADEFIHDKAKAYHLLSAAIAKAEMHHSALHKVWNDLQSLFRLSKAWLRGEYNEIPWQSITFAITAIVYFVNPFDIIPDFIPGSGYLDDATVVGFVLRSIKRDITAFLDWEGGSVAASGEHANDL